jgi:hypothetical protein
MTFASWVDGVVVPIVDKGIIPLLYSLAFLFFIFGIARFFFSSNEEHREQGRAFAIWGIIGLFVLFSIWGIVKILLSTLTGFAQ